MVAKTRYIQNKKATLAVTVGKNKKILKLKIEPIKIGSMANTYTQLNVQTVFAVKGRENIITSNFRSQLFEYIAGILRNNKQYPLAVNGCKDHVHIFFELNPDYSLSNVLEIVKANSSKWINSNKFVLGRFEWQRGYSGFTYSRSQRNNVIKYIMNQENHHKALTFRVEYLEMLKKFEMEYDERYIFEFYEGRHTTSYHTVAAMRLLGGAGLLLATILSPLRGLKLFDNMHRLCYHNVAAMRLKRRVAPKVW